MYRKFNFSAPSFFHGFGTPLLAAFLEKARKGYSISCSGMVYDTLGHYQNFLILPSFSHIFPI